MQFLSFAQSLLPMLNGSSISPIFTMIKSDVTDLRPFDHACKSSRVALSGQMVLDVRISRPPRCLHLFYSIVPPPQSLIPEFLGFLSHDDYSF